MARNTEFLNKVNKNIGHKVKERRIALGMSRVYFASAIGVTHQQVQKYETGANRISVARMLLIARALRTGYDHFINDVMLTTPSPTTRSTKRLIIAQSLSKIRSPESLEIVGSIVNVLAKSERLG